MPFLRLSRDKRGYEHTYLVDTIARRGKPSRTRILYWYRTPPGVRVGRSAFDSEIRRSLETKYPNITFDWDALVATPMPPPEPEYWRERRRAEKAVKQARRQEEADETAIADEPVSVPSTDVPADAQSADPGELAADAVATLVSGSGVSSPALPSPDGSGRRRRRRGGRRRRGRLGGGPADLPEGSAPGADDATAAVNFEADSEADQGADSGDSDLENGGPPEGDDPASEGE